MTCMSSQAGSFLHFITFKCPAHIMSILPREGTEVVLFLFNTEILFIYGNCYWLPLTALNIWRPCIMSPSDVIFLTNWRILLTPCYYHHTFLQNCQPPNCASFHTCRLLLQTKCWIFICLSFFSPFLKLFRNILYFVLNRPIKIYTKCTFRMRTLRRFITAEQSREVIIKGKWMAQLWS